MNAAAIHNENQLVRDLQLGSEAAFTALYRHYSIPLYYNILSLVKDENTAEELVQEVFTKIWRQHSSITIEKNFAAYLFVTARNRVFDFFRQLTKEQALYAKIKSLASEQYDQIEQTLFARENADLLNKAIATLPPQRRRAFELCKIEGLTYREASEKMGVSLSTLKDHMIYALDAIRSYISKNMEIAGALLFYGFFSMPS